MEVSIHGESPKWMVYSGNPINHYIGIDIYIYTIIYIVGYSKEYHWDIYIGIPIVWHSIGISYKNNMLFLVHPMYIHMGYEWDVICILVRYVANRMMFG